MADTCTIHGMERSGEGFGGRRSRRVAWVGVWNVLRGKVDAGTGRMGWIEESGLRLLLAMEFCMYVCCMRCWAD